MKKKNVQTDPHHIKEEIKTMQALDHPNVINYINIYESEKDIHLVMELAKGKMLFDYILETDGNIPEEETKKCMHVLIKAMYHCHANGIVHRDLKPTNIMFKEDSADWDGLRVIDFGLAKRRLEYLHTNLGSP